jgi:hypothetical protein
VAGRRFQPTSSKEWLLGAQNVERLNVRNRATGITTNRESEGWRIGLSRLDHPYNVKRRAALATAAVNGESNLRGSLRHGVVYDCSGEASAAQSHAGREQSSGRFPNQARSWARPPGRAERGTLPAKRAAPKIIPPKCSYRFRPVQLCRTLYELDYSWPDHNPLYALLDHNPQHSY